MASQALDDFTRALDELQALQAADPTPKGSISVDPDRTRVLGRASVVLLSSHFERYVYAINEEATAVVNARGLHGHTLPANMRLLHTKTPLDALLSTDWDNREDQLGDLVEKDGWLWSEGQQGFLDHERLLVWMGAPTPKNLRRFYRFWGIDDIFRSITRAPHVRSDMHFKLDELVSKRNNIAHGDRSTEATALDVWSYRNAASTFAQRADRALSRSVRKLSGGGDPW